MNFRLARWPWLFALFLALPSFASLSKDARVLSPFTKPAALGQLASRTDFNAKTTTFNYDVMGRLLQKVPDTSFGTNSIITFTYTVSGQRATMSDVSGTTTYGYDANRDWLVSKTKVNSAFTVTLNYTNDVAGNVVAMKTSTANGTLVYYQWDALNRLAGVSGPNVGQTTYGYDGVGNLAGYTYPNGVANAFAYDSLNRLTNQVASRGTNVASYAYTLGAAGNRTAVTELNARAVNYAYDPLYRLTGETVSNDPIGSNGAIGYTFDGVGNRLARSSNISAIPAASHSYTANDWLTSDSYDSNGNTVGSGGMADSYDFENHLVGHGYAITLVYDGDGNRVKKTASGISTYYVVDDRNPTGYAQVIEELTAGYYGSPVLQRVYTWGHALISQDQLINNQWAMSFYGHDGHGSVRYLTDLQGNVTDAYAYDAFGVLIRAAGSTPNLYLYCGEQYDPDLGFYYLRARYSNPKTGRFWNMDSYEGNSEDPRSLHKYLYCQANPINGRDPSGHDFSAISMSVSGSMATSLQSVYDGGVSAVGSAMQASIFGIQSGLGANEILTGFIFDETGIGLGIDVFNAVRGLFQDKESQEVAAYILWREQLIATLFAAMEEDEFGQITVELEPQCFVAGTPVATEAGLKPIEGIRPGDKVWAWNEATDEVTLRPVVNRFIHRRSEVFEIKVGRDVFKVTGEHPFYVAGKGWTPTRDVRSGDQFVTSENSALVVDAIAKQEGEVLVYNFEVSTDHNYYVGEEGILTHNVSALRKALGLKNAALAAHHIVAFRALGASGARELLRKANIGLNNIANGVPLPKNLKVKAPRGFQSATIHSLVHTRKYYEEVERQLEAVFPGRRMEVLQTIGKELKLGKFPYR